MLTVQIKVVGTEEFAVVFLLRKLANEMAAVRAKEWSVSDDSGSATAKIDDQSTEGYP